MDLSERPAGAFARHPWEEARARFFRRVLEAAGVGRAPVAVLDVGAGDGWLASRLAAGLPAGSRVVCWDAGYEASAVARAETPGLAFTRTRPPGRFEVVLLLDVLEHVADDAAFLAAVVRESLAAEGIVLASVPAWRRLYSAHDRRLRHFRRYDPGQGRALLEGAGLRVVRAGGLFHSLLPPRALARALEAVRPPAPSPPPPLEWRGGERLRRAVLGWLALDTALSLRLASAGRSLPGLSWWALCRT
jgi:SAM-dependent methyltransferase